LEKYDNIKLKGVRLQDEHAPFEVRDLHHWDVTSMSNLKMIPKAVLDSFVQLGAHKT
jgi:hypothetical protein